MLRLKGAKRESYHEALANAKSRSRAAALHRESLALGLQLCAADNIRMSRIRLSTFADKIDRAVQRVTPFAYRLRRRGRRWMRRALRKPRSVSEGPNLLPLLIQVLASFSKADGVLLEEEIDSSLGFLRYDYPEAVYSELRQLFRQALYEQQDLSAMAQKLAAAA